MLSSYCFLACVLCCILWFSDGSLGSTYQSNQFKNNEELSIFNGVYTNITAYPTTAAFLISNDIWGAGAIYNKNWIVTSAFNCHWVDPKYMGVRVGSSNWTTGGQLFSVDKCVMHPSYNPYTGVNSIAMVKLNGNITYGPGVRAAFMPLQQNFTGRNLSVAGWGVRSKEFIKETMLQASIQKVLTVEECSKKYNMTSTNICAYNTTSSPCIFDFGAPLMLKRFLVGLYMDSKDCTKPKLNPSKYLQIYPYTEWMEKTAKSNLIAN